MLHWSLINILETKYYIKSAEHKPASWLVLCGTENYSILEREYSASPNNQNISSLWYNIQKQYVSQEKILESSNQFCFCCESSDRTLCSPACTNKIVNN